MMRKFIFRIIAYFLILITIIVGSLFVYKYKINNLKLKENISILICGDSHTESGINDSILKNTINISNISEHYLYTYNVLKLILNNDNKIKKIILGCSFHSFGKKYDDVIYKNDKELEMYTRSYQVCKNKTD